MASEIDDVKNFFRSGDYQACIKLAGEQVEKGVWNELWPRMLIESYLATGEYPAALKAFEKAKERFGESIRLRLVGVRVYKMNNAANKAEEQLAFLEAMYIRTPWRFTNKSDLVASGDFFLARGADPKEVLKNCFDPATKSNSTAEMFEAHLATARLAIDKNDDKVASQSLAKALKLDETDPELFYLLGKSWNATDPAKSAEYFAKSIELNAKFVPSLIHAAEARMSAEDYESAEEILAQVEQVNPNLPVLWALRAAIAHLQGRYEAEGEARRKGLLTMGLEPRSGFYRRQAIGNALSVHRSRRIPNACSQNGRGLYSRQNAISTGFIKVRENR